MKIHALRLKPDQDLKLSIEGFVIEHKIHAGAIVTCVGSLKVANIRMAGEKESVQFIEKFEIVSLVGTLSDEGCHLHISVSDKDGTVIGGHLKEGCVIYTTAEIVLAELKEYIFTREPDKATGYKELQIKKS